MHESRTPSAENLALCDWNLYVTNVEETEHQRMFDIVFVGKSIFKLWKSHCKLANSNSKNPYRILCEIYTKLLFLFNIGLF